MRARVAVGGAVIEVSMRLPVLSLVMVLAATSACLAAPMIVIPRKLQQSAVLCLGEALRLCPNALAAKDHGVSCILGKRRSLSRPCQTVYDQGVRLLRGQDIHIDLRRPAAP